MMIGIYYQGDYCLRKLELNDWQAYRDIRLYALLHSPEVYGSTYAAEVERNDDSWQERLQNPNCAYFGLYFMDKLIGLTGIFRHNNSEQEAILISSYIMPQHRGKGLSTLLYAARLDWAKANGYKRIIVSHRADNLASKAANQRAGFLFTHQQNHLWPDGAEVDELFYKLEI